MTNSNLSYEELEKRYEELQLRVTRFASIQQELINTRNMLDQELELYKKLQHCIGKMLEANSDDDLMRMTAEAIVDILEIECSLVYVRNISSPELSSLYVEGCNYPHSHKELEQDLNLLHQKVEETKNHVITRETLKKCKHISSLDSAIMRCFQEPDLDYELFLMGGISIDNAPSYSRMQERHINIFLIFAHQMQSVLANRKRHEKIETQIKKISDSEIELRKLSLIATKTNSGVIIADTYGCIEWVNEAFTKISGYTLDEVKGNKPKDYLQGKETPEDKKLLLKKALANKEDIELVIINHRKDGTLYYNQLEIISIFDEAGNHTHFIAIQKDITQEIISRQEILKINSRFKTITDTTQTGIWEWDLRHNSITWNDKLYQILGINPNVTAGHDLFEAWKSTLHPDDMNNVIADLDHMQSGEKNNSRVEYRIVRNNDHEIRDCISVTVAERDEKNQILRLVGSMQDVTEQTIIQRDILQKNEELRKINAELDHFVYSISHDLRSPLLSIKGIISLVLKTPDLSEENIKLLNMTLGSTTRLDSTIQEILEYSRNSRLNIANESMNIRELVQSVFDDLKFAANTSVHLNLNSIGDAVINSDKARLGVLLKNIIGNSIKYRKNETEAEINISISTKDRMLQVKIQDNGEGIPEKHLGKVFDMFYRATTTSIGTGLGLYICKEIVHKLKGNISLSSEHGVGTTVQFTIPLNQN